MPCSTGCRSCGRVACVVWQTQELTCNDRDGKLSYHLKAWNAKRLATCAPVKCHRSCFEFSRDARNLFMIPAPSKCAYACLGAWQCNMKCVQHTAATGRQVMIRLAWHWTEKILNWLGNPAVPSSIALVQTYRTKIPEGLAAVAAQHGIK